jgi:parvulin-like peptidyl-prolyl isomerase
LIKWFKAVALVLAAVLFFSGCSMITKNSDKVENQAVATVNGTPVYRYQVEKYFEITYFLESYYYSGYGSSVDLSSTDARASNKSYLESTVDNLAYLEVLKQKANEFGLALTDDEKTSNRTNADDFFSSIKDSIQTEVESAAKTDATIDITSEVESQYEAQLTAMGFTADDYYNFLNDQKLLSKVDDYTHQFAEVTDDDVTKWYNDTLAQQKKDMDSTPSVFATDVYGSYIITYIPEDTIAVKQVLLTYADTNLSAVATQLYSDEDTKEAMAILKPQIDELTIKAQDIVQQLKNGTSIDDLIAKYGEDPDMASGGTRATTGYLVGSSTINYLDEFKNAAIQLKNVGDVSDPVVTYYGLHVLQAIKVYKKGEVSFDSLKDQIKAALLPTKQTAKQTELEDQWKSEAKITYDKGRMFN